MKWIISGLVLLLAACSALIAGAVLDSSLISVAGTVAAIGMFGVYALYVRHDNLRLFFLNSGLLIGVVLAAALFETLR
ncbi:MAG: hypothetical protein WBD40_00140 [Tepidisphaeraceae bacterium]